MKNNIDNYYNFEIIKNYQKLDDKIIVTYLNGYVAKLDISNEQNILVLMEEQGKNYIKKINNKKQYLFKIISATTGLVIILFGTLNWLEKLCTTNINDETLLFGTIASSSIIAIDIILFKKLFKNLSSQISLFEDQEKYQYYFKNKETINKYITINELDDYSLSELKKVVNLKNKIKTKTKRKR